MTFTKKDFRIAYLEIFNSIISIPFQHLLTENVAKAGDVSLDCNCSGGCNSKLFKHSPISPCSRDGFALSTLYRKMQELDCPILMVIQVGKRGEIRHISRFMNVLKQDVDHVIFGGLLSEPPKVTDSFCGKKKRLFR